MISIKIEIQEILDTRKESEILTDRQPNKIENLHPNYQLLGKLSKRGILGDQLIIKMGFF